MGFSFLWVNAQPKLLNLEYHVDLQWAIQAHLKKGEKILGEGQPPYRYCMLHLIERERRKKKSHWLQAYNNIMAWPILIIGYHRYKVQQMKSNIFRSRTNKNDTNACTGIIEKCLARNPLI